jgi:signal transduction histidine kinase
MSESIAEKDLAVLFDVSRATTEGGQDAFLHHILEGCVRWFSASGTSVFIKQEPSEEFVLAAKLGADSTVPDRAHLRSGQGIAGACIATGQPMLVQDPLDNPLLKGRVRTREDIGSAMVVPLVTPESGCIGVLNVSRRIGEVPFSASDLLQAAPLARHIAMAVSNAQLFSRLNTAIAETKTVNEKLDAIISCLGVSVIVVDAGGRLEQWNPEAEQLVGSKMRKGCALHDVLADVPGELRLQALKGLRRALAGKRYRERAHDAQADQAWSIVASPLPGGGATVALQDVSLHEKALRELDRVKRLAEIGQMTAAIAHEIRNPLTGIRSASQIVQSAPGELAEFGRIIEREALKLNSLCDQFLEFAKPLNLHLERVDLVDIVQAVAKEYVSTAQHLGIDLRLVLDGRASRIKADPVRFEQVCRNLFLNALQATTTGGHVTVSLLKGQLVVEDDGKGIDSEVVDKLFTPFFTTKASGTGLGLSNVRKIVDAHGWQIKVVSRPGAGTRFELVFHEQKAA